MKKNRAFIFLLASSFFVFAINPVGYAQGASPGNDPMAAGASKDGNVTMDFKNADIHNVLRILSYKGGVNIVAGPEVAGFVTIRLTDVPWEKALDVVLRTYGFAYEREGNIIRVTTIESLKQEELTTEVYTLNYAKSEEVVESIQEMLTARGKAKYDARTNVVIATDIPTNLYKIGQIVKKLDMRTPQVLIEAKIIETRLDDDEYLGIDWHAKISVMGAKKPTTFPFTRRVTTSLEDNVDKFFAIGNSDPATPGDQYAGTTESEFPGGEIREKSIFPFVETDQFAFGTLDFSSFQAVLEYLESRTDTDILSNPRITTLNNKKSSIHVGDTMFFPTFERNEETGTLEMTSLGEEGKRELGVVLNVTPHINREGDIVVELKPQVSSFSGTQTLDQSRGIVATVFTVREAEAEVMVRDGDTIMLGGLITKSTADRKTKLPLLGDIPFIGDYLFSKKEKIVDRTELIIFITVHLVKEKWQTKVDPNVKYANIPQPKDKQVSGALPVRKLQKKWWELPWKAR
ncbi:MAG: secretin and TonB N-terminal domain-containing protein [Candidatus Omnitrophica bacterium]|nr:secretin and TonB N-terminal domain-containing protein [Candidatus Omnitrophota bacterium]